jgi:hypothetical protein
MNRFRAILIGVKSKLATNLDGESAAVSGHVADKTPERNFPVPTPDKAMHVHNHAALPVGG